MLLKKRSLKYRLLQMMAFFGDAGLEFLANDLFRGKRVFIHRRHYSVDYCSRLLRELTTTGYIERVNKQGVSYLRLTPQAETKLKRDIPLAYLQRKRWDGYFRAIPYDFPEKLKSRREALRRLIKSWGMGLFQRSLWITPHPLEEVIDEFIVSQDLSDFTIRFMSKKMSISEGASLAEKVWPIKELENQYLDFIDETKAKLAKEKLTSADKEDSQQEYFSILGKDPHLPVELLPSYWPAEKAKKVYLSIQKQ